MRLLGAVFEQFHQVFDAQLDAKLGAYQTLSETEQQAASLVLVGWPIAIQEAQLEKQGVGYALFHSENSQAATIDTLRCEGWARAFKVIFGSELGYELHRVTLANLPGPFAIQGVPAPVKEHKLFKIGDVLVGLGLAYWTCFVSTVGNTSINLKVPDFLADRLSRYEQDYQPTSNISEKLRSLGLGSSKFLEPQPWSADEIMDDEIASEVLEADIEQSLLTRPELLETGLTWFDPRRPSQFQTGVGRIDLLAVDSRDNIVVIELKKGHAGAEVAGQIQKYMAWVDQNLSNGRTVRGIIVASRAENDLEFAIRGSRYPIEIKVFGNVPPVDQNLAFCSSCGAPIPKRVRHCATCGQEQWL